MIMSLVSGCHFLCNFACPYQKGQYRESFSFDVLSVVGRHHFTAGQLRHSEMKELKSQPSQLSLEAKALASQPPTSYQRRSLVQTTL